MTGRYRGDVDVEVVWCCLEICLWYEEGKVWELEEAVEFIGSRSFQASFPMMMR